MPPIQLRQSGLAGGGRPILPGHPIGAERCMYPAPAGSLRTSPVIAPADMTRPHFQTIVLSSLFSVSDAAADAPFHIAV